jgi:hypothetical protein
MPIRLASMLHYQIELCTLVYLCENNNKLNLLYPFIEEPSIFDRKGNKKPLWCQDLSLYIR